MSVVRWTGRGAGVRRIVFVTLVAFVAVTLLPRFGGLAGSGEAYAASPRADRRVALFVVPANARYANEANALQLLLRGELWRLEAIVGVGPNADPRESSQQRFGARVEAAYRILNERKGPEAVAAFTPIYEELVGYGAPFDRRLTARVVKGLAVAHALAGSMERAEEFMAAALNLYPGQQPAEYGWTLDARTAFNEVVQRRMGQATGSVDLTTEPDGAAVFVDGRLKGVAPIELTDLAPGPHWLEAVTDGYGRASQWVHVQAGSGTLTHLDLGTLKSRRQIAANIRTVTRLSGSSRVAEPVRVLQRDCNAETIVVLTVAKDRDGAFVFGGWTRRGAGAVNAVSEQTVAQDGALLDNGREMLAAVLGATVLPEDDIVSLDGPPQASVMSGDDLYIDPNDPIFKKDEKKQTESVTEKWWFWVIAGGVTAGLVAGGVVLFSGSDEGSGPSGNLVLNLNRP